MEATQEGFPVDMLPNALLWGKQVVGAKDSLVKLRGQLGAGNYTILIL